MTSKIHGRFVQWTLAAIIAPGCVMYAWGQVESANIVGYTAISEVKTNSFFIQATGERPVAVFNSFCYEMQDGVAVIVGYTGTNSTVHIPAMIEGSPVKVAEPMGASIIERITVSDENKYHKAVDGVLFSGDGTVLIQYPEASRRRQYAVPDEVTTIGDEAFSRSTSLTSVILPVGVTSIGDDAFSCCSVLTTINVDTKNKVYSSLDGVLFDKTRTTLIRYPTGRSGSYTVPADVTTVKADAFSGCTALIAINVDEDNTSYCGYDGVLFDKQMKTLIRCPPAREGEVIIPDGVENIANVAFENCERLTEITLPASLEYLGYCCFGRCRNLQRVFFRGNAPKSGGGAFWDTKTTVYYLAGAAGWGNEYDKRPTALWDPKKPLPPLDPPSRSAEATRAQVAVTLKVGAPAPQLKQGKYVQGEPVAAFENGKVYVVEFWATWCGPCRAVIPHVNALQEKYRDKGLVVIGQNVWQRGENVEGDVAEFVKEMGADMTYRVALDCDGAMAESWMKAAGRKGIPSAFLVDRQGKIAWIGHPSSGLDEAVEKALGDGAGE